MLLALCSARFISRQAAGSRQYAGRLARSALWGSAASHAIILSHIQYTERPPTARRTCRKVWPPRTELSRSVMVFVRQTRSLIERAGPVFVVDVGRDGVSRANLCSHHLRNGGPVVFSFKFSIMSTGRSFLPLERHLRDSLRWWKSHRRLHKVVIWHYGVERR